MKKYLLNIALSVVLVAILIAAGFNAVSGQVTVEEKQSSFKLTDFDFIVRSPSNAQIADFDANNTAVKSVFPCYEFEVTCKSESTNPVIRILFSDDMDDYGIGLFNEKTLVSGSFDKEGLMIDEKAAEKLRASVGDSVTLKLKGKNVTYKVAAIYRASTYDTLDEGLGLVEFTKEIADLYKDNPKKLSYTMAFMDAADEDALATSLTSYKPLGNLKLYEDFAKDYTRRPGLTDDQWSEFLDAEYSKYYEEAAKELKAEGNVERKSDFMADVADKIETTQHKVDALTVGIAIACAVVFALVSAVILYLGKNNDLILAREGAEKSHIAREKLAVSLASTLFVALVSFGVLFGFASAKGFVNETIGAVMLCSLPVLVNIPVSFVTVKLYVDGIYGKAQMAREDEGFLRLEEGEYAPVDAPTEDAPVDTPTEDTPVDTPTEDAPAEDAPTEDTPTEDAPSETSLKDVAPMDNGDVGGAPKNDNGTREDGSPEHGEGIDAADASLDTDTPTDDTPTDNTPVIVVTEGKLGSDGNTEE